MKKILSVDKIMINFEKVVNYRQKQYFVTSKIQSPKNLVNWVHFFGIKIVENSMKIDHDGWIDMKLILNSNF